LGTNISDDLLAYRLIKSANLSEQDEKMVKATCSLTYDDVKSKLKNIFGDSGCSQNFTASVVKKEEVYETHRGDYHSSFAGRGNRSRGSRGRYKSVRFSLKDGKNPLGKNGKTTLCLICKSEYHWANLCPHRGGAVDEVGREESPLVVEHVVLLQSLSSEGGSNLNDLLSETWNCAIVDCGATKTVAGRAWVDNYLASLPDFEKQNVKFSPCKTSYRFGDGKQVFAVENVSLPVHIGTKSLFINTDVVDKNIPLLLSRESMKKGSGLVS